MIIKIILVNKISLKDLIIWVLKIFYLKIIKKFLSVNQLKHLMVRLYMSVLPVRMNKQLKKLLVNVFNNN